MSEEGRNGNRRRRERVDRCNLRLGNYLIITDVKKQKNSIWKA